MQLIFNFPFYTDSLFVKKSLYCLTLTSYVEIYWLSESFLQLLKEFWKLQYFLMVQWTTFNSKRSRELWFFIIWLMQFNGFCVKYLMTLRSHILHFLILQCVSSFFQTLFATLYVRLKYTNDPCYDWISSLHTK